MRRRPSGHEGDPHKPIRPVGGDADVPRAARRGGLRAAARDQALPEGEGDVMHRTRVRVVEDALDANNTIARANRTDFDRAGVAVINLMSAPGAGKTALLERVLADTGDIRVGVLE